MPAFDTIPRFVRKNGSKQRAVARQWRIGRRPDSGTPVVQLRDVTVVYPGGNVGLDGASVAIDRGEFAFLVGPTGCGKSTFIRLLMKEVEPARGQVLIAGRDIGELPRHEGAEAAAQHRRRLPGLQAAAEPHRLRQRRLLPCR